MEGSRRGVSEDMIAVDGVCVWMNEALRMRLSRWRFSGWSCARVVFTIMTSMIFAQHKVERSILEDVYRWFTIDSYGRREAALVRWQHLRHHTCDIT